MELGGIENWKRRRSLLAKGYRNQKRKEWAIGQGFFWKLTELEADKRVIREELMEVGGVPKSW